MNQLSREASARARGYLKNQARPTDGTLFEPRFEDGPVDAVLDARAAYQNEDGGFGHALEPDMRTPSSSALATGIGLRVPKLEWRGEITLATLTMLRAFGRL